MSSIPVPPRPNASAAFRCFARSGAPRFAAAHTSSASHSPLATPNGEYAYEPWGPTISWVGLGSLLGTCASPCRNPASEPVLDCELVAAHGK